MDWIQLTQETIQGRILVYMVKKLHYIQSKEFLNP